MKIEIYKEILEEISLLVALLQTTLFVQEIAMMNSENKFEGFVLGFEYFSIKNCTRTNFETLSFFAQK